LAAVSPQEVPALGGEDLVILIGKLPDFPAVAAWLSPKLGKDTGVIGLHNGLGLDEYLAPLLGRPLDRGLVFFGGFCRQPGQVSYYRGGLRLRPALAARALSELLSGMPVKCELVENFRQAEWDKLAINCLANPLAGLLGVGNDTLVLPGLDPVKDALLSEVKAVAAAEGVELGLTAADFNRLVRTDNVPSLRADILRGRPTEIDFLNGAIVRLGRRYKVPTPVNEVVVNLIKFLGQLGAPPAG
jgi:2-dehydropantoate 2-reductase